MEEVKDTLLTCPSSSLGDEHNIPSRCGLDWVAQASEWSTLAFSALSSPDGVLGRGDGCRWYNRPS